MDNKLNIRQLRFIDNLFLGKSQKQAYIDAGYKCSEGSAEVLSSRMLRNAKISDEIGRRLNDINTKNRVRLGRISELALSELLNLMKSNEVDSKTKLGAIIDSLDRSGLKPVEDIHLKLSGEVKVTDVRQKILSRIDSIASRKKEKRDHQ
jgi:phage terminase small subunit